MSPTLEGSTRDCKGACVRVRVRVRVGVCVGYMRAMGGGCVCVLCAWCEVLCMLVFCARVVCVYAYVWVCVHVLR